MKNNLLSIILVFFCLAAGESQAKMAITINMPIDSSVDAHPSSQRIKEIATDVLKKQSVANRENYYDYAKVTFKNNDKHPYLLITLHSRVFALKKVIRVNLDKDYNVLSTILDKPKTTPQQL